MQFPLWQYLKQPLFEVEHPVILNPVRYWQAYKIQYLKRCVENAFLEQCWHYDYQDFVTKYHYSIDRNYLEENHLALLEACWLRNPKSRRRYLFDETF